MIVPRKLFWRADPRSGENPRDVLIAAPDLYERLLSKTDRRAIRIGTSSPRRLENLKSLLPDLLPYEGEKQKIEFVDLRGNVNTRMKRLHPHLNDNRSSLDAIVLAAAGINRLLQSAESKAEILELMNGCRVMMLPILENPTAPGQGALAVECRRNDTELYEVLHKALHCEETERQVKVEREMLSAWGGRRLPFEARGDGFEFSGTG